MVTCKEVIRLMQNTSVIRAVRYVGEWPDSVKCVEKEIYQLNKNKNAFQLNAHRLLANWTQPRTSKNLQFDSGITLTSK